MSVGICCFLAVARESICALHLRLSDLDISQTESRHITQRNTTGHTSPARIKTFPPLPSLLSGSAKQPILSIQFDIWKCDVEVMKYALHRYRGKMRWKQKYRHKLSSHSKGHVRESSKVMWLCAHWSNGDCGTAYEKVWAGWRTRVLTFLNVPTIVLLGSPWLHCPKTSSERDIQEAENADTR